MRDYDEPRGSDICPQCGESHTFALVRHRGLFGTITPDSPVVFYSCPSCRSRWKVQGNVATKEFVIEHTIIYDTAP